LRSQLTRLGFGTAAPEVWIAPAHLRKSTEEVLRRLELDTYADLFQAEHLAFDDVTEKVGEWWDLNQLEALYRDFLEAHTPVLQRWRRRRAPHERAAFADYVGVLTDWRRLPYLDPGLPAELLGYRGTTFTSGGHGLAAMSRKRLLNILQMRCLVSSE
jgi:phenylacetic acid degradation operon negative regulatory protein